MSSIEKHEQSVSSQFKNMSSASFIREPSISIAKSKQQQRRLVDHNRNVILSFPQHRRISSFETRVLSSFLIPTVMILFVFTLIQISDAFVINNQQHTVKIVQRNVPLHQQPPTTNMMQTGVTIPFSVRTTSSSSCSSSALHVWWYGGSESVESNMNSSNDDSCELVAVRIERTSPNSRRIFGDITINAPIQDVWSILTDYNRLAIHVPNLVESKIERPLNNGNMGDGQYQCRLYQKGAQKIIGFEFGASVTMDMREVVSIPFNNNSNNGRQTNALAIPVTDPNIVLREERKILFKCVDSFYFREFDGEWKVQEFNNLNTGTIKTLLSYVVDVRPKGPVPVAALEWRIREDVPTNLRAVKKSALAIQQDDVLMSKRRALQQQQQQSIAFTSSAKTPNDALTTVVSSKQQQEKSKASTARFTAFARDARTKIQWLQDETMAAYLPDTKNT
jgi:hypothetical protein